MNIEDAKASLEQAITGHTAKHWSYTPAVRALLNYIAELESRTVTVKLTDVNEYLAEVHDKTLALTFRRLAEGVRAGDIAEMTAAGIQVIEGDSQDGN